MRDPPCHCPDCLHLLGVAELVFKLLLITDVPYDLYPGHDIPLQVP